MKIFATGCKQRATFCCFLEIISRYTVWLEPMSPLRLLPVLQPCWGAAGLQSRVACLAMTPTIPVLQPCSNWLLAPPHCQQCQMLSICCHRLAQIIPIRETGNKILNFYSNWNCRCCYMTNFNSCAYICLLSGAAPAAAVSGPQKWRDKLTLPPFLFVSFIPVETFQRERSANIRHRKTGVWPPRRPLRS